MRNALAACPDEIPVIVISFNNGIYVRNMVEQLQGFGVVPIIIDNHSTDIATQNTLHEFEREGKAHIALAASPVELHRERLEARVRLPAAMSYAAFHTCRRGSLWMNPCASSSVPYR